MPRFEMRLEPLGELRRPRVSDATDERWMSEETRLAVESAARWCVERRSGRVIALATGATYMRVLCAVPGDARSNPRGLAQSIRRQSDRRTRGSPRRVRGEHVFATRVHVDYLNAETAARISGLMNK